MNAIAHSWRRILGRARPAIQVIGVPAHERPVHAAEAPAVEIAPNDPLMALQTLKRAFTTDVQPILAQARLNKGSAIDPLAVYRLSGYRAQCARRRPPVTDSSSGIV